VIEDARLRQRRHRRVGGAVLATGTAVLVFLVASGGGSPGRTSSTAQPGRAKPVAKSPTLVNASCAWHETLSGSPGRSLLSILGVLRAPAATPSASVLAEVERPVSANNGTELYVNYIRLARFFEGQAYYIAAIHFDRCGPGSSANETGDSILVDSDDGGDMGGNPQRIETGRWVGTGSPGIQGDQYSGTVQMVVPDGVASATVHYPAGPADGFRPTVISPAVTVTGKAIGNLLLFNVPRGSGGGQITHPTSMIWRNADGTIIRRFHGRL
jgi:hypothetical protein